MIYYTFLISILVCVFSSGILYHSELSACCSILVKSVSPALLGHECGQITSQVGFSEVEMMEFFRIGPGIASVALAVEPIISAL